MIIGAGVVGVTTAYALARRGVDVTLIDFCDGAGDGADGLRRLIEHGTDARARSPRAMCGVCTC